jgi:hypothetical protein
MNPRINLFAEHEREDRRPKERRSVAQFITKHVDFKALAAGINDVFDPLAPNGRVFVRCMKSCTPPSP